MDKQIDLHIHTYHSDGDHSPTAIMNLAIKKGLTDIAITDHDTILAYQDLKTQCFKKINLIPGIELSVKVPTGKMHILGYNIDLNNKELNQALTAIRLHSIDSVLAIISQIKKDYHISFPQFEIDKLISTPSNIGRPDIARLCVQYGYSVSSQDAFDKYLIAAHEKTRITSKFPFPEEAISLIKKTGGLPVLAHPYSLRKTKKELLLLIKELIPYGLKGIEVYNSAHNREQTSEYLDLANTYNLLISGGSDYHGDFIHPDFEIGTGKNNNINLKQLSLLNHLQHKKNVS